MIATRHSSCRARRASLLGALLAAAALLAGCGGGTKTVTVNAAGGTVGGSGPAKAGVYAGLVEGTDTNIALVSDGKRLTGAYVCNSRLKVGRWIRPAPLANNRAGLVARNGDSVGEATLAGDRASGSLTIGPGSGSFSAQIATGKAGLYRTASGTAAKPGFKETGWIVTPNGSTCGYTTTLTSKGSTIRPAPPTPKGKITNFANPFPF